MSKNSISTKQQHQESKKYQYIQLCILFLGLFTFNTSFFLAKKTLYDTSKCNDAEFLLNDVLHLSKKDIDYLTNIEKVLIDHDDEHQSFVDNNNKDKKQKGCWMPELTTKIGIIVVDALRFDFAVSSLPKSIGSRINYDNSNNITKGSKSSRSRLFQFVADPPTTTAQRLKALTTGGLPTFVDIFKNFGGNDNAESHVEDSWVYQSKKENKKMVFVGDDTWMDLFDKDYFFKEAYPFPSFNTRDLDTVDNGCLYYLPKFLPSLAGSSSGNSDSNNDIVIMHFLGVDHVGHTYGPNDIHMKEKLNTIDDALSTILDTIDDVQQHNDNDNECHGVFIFGDHGMTNDGNHGGGSYEETHAALFTHFSPSCHTNNLSTLLSDFDINDESSAINKKKNNNNKDETIEIFNTIHQIDLVPTISIILGIPIPYSNLGSIITSIIPTQSTSYIATSLALNSAQVWNYLQKYNKLANNPFTISDMNKLQQYLNDSIYAYQLAIHEEKDRDKKEILYEKSCILFKSFLNEVFELGIYTWTTFNIKGMVIGIILLVLVLLLKFLQILNNPIQKIILQHYNYYHYFKSNTATLIEIIVTSIFIIFSCIVLTFSNSYILSEQHILMFALAIISMLITYNRIKTLLPSLIASSSSSSSSSSIIVNNKPNHNNNHNYYYFLPIIISILSRVHELCIYGHGVDISLQLHTSHHPMIFIPSLIGLGVLGIYYNPFKKNNNFTCSSSSSSSSSDHHDSSLSIIKLYVIASSLSFLGINWCYKYYKYDVNTSIIAQSTSLIAFIIPLLHCLLYILSKILLHFNNTRIITTTINIQRNKNDDDYCYYQSSYFFCFNFLIVIMNTTGPSSASSGLIFWIQFLCFSFIALQYPTHNLIPISDVIIAFIWRIIIRHTFYATNHACFFEQVQFSSAFIFTTTFNFYTSGFLLFINTFGWDILGSILLLFICFHRQQLHHRKVNKEEKKENNITNNDNTTIWKWYCWFQLCETSISCISVSILRRHLMVWAIFAPRFVYSIIFLFLNICICLVFGCF